MIPIHYGGAQFYFNSTLIYESRHISRNGAFEQIQGKPDLIRIPQNILKSGKNVLAIRTCSLDNDCNFFKPPLFGDYNILKGKFLFFLFKIISFSSINIFLSIFFIILFLFRKKEIYYFYYSCLSLSIGLWLLGVWGVILYIFDNKTIYGITTFAFSCIIILSWRSFFHEILNIKKTIISRLFLYYNAFELLWLVVEIALTGGVYYFNTYIYKFHIVNTFLFICYFSGLSVYSVIIKRPYSKIIMIGVFFLAVPTIIGVIDFLRIYRIEAPIAEGFFLMNITFAVVLASRYAQVHTDLEQSHTDLQVLDKMKDDFLATTSHELRTPLHGIIGLTESIADGSLGEVNERQRESVSLIRQSATRLNALVNDILDFGRIRAGRADLVLAEMDLGDAVRMVVSLMAPTLKGTDVTLAAEIWEIPRIHADRNRVHQVLLNLVGNALKFTERGSVTVTARREGPDAVAVSVADTGIGIKEKDIDRLFQPFERSADPDTQMAGGTGLGLAIAKRLVELHGGAIRAESVPGEGSTFTFTLPVHPGARGIEKAPQAGQDGAAGIAAVTDRAARLQGPEDDSVDVDIAAAEPAALADAVILAVDDDPVNLKILRSVCDRAGYRIVTAENGPQALAMVERDRIDLVILDLMLPGMSGFEVCQRIRETRAGQFLPVVIVTARDQISDLVRGFKTGANDYITKPFNRNELHLRIENQLAIKYMLDMERSLMNGMRREKDAITDLFRRSLSLRDSALQMVEWERIIQEDLHIAHQFQMKLMTNSPSVQELETYVHYQPLLQIGGDIYDIFEARPGVLRVFIADATGHGINASLNTVKILSEYAAVKETMASPAELANHLNQRFVQFFKEYQIIFTFVLADIDTRAGRVLITTPGHPEQYILSGTRIVPIRLRGPIVGISEQVVYEEQEYELLPGDAMVLFTDGVFEYFSGNRLIYQSQSLQDTGILDDVIQYGVAEHTAEELALRMMAYFISAGGGGLIDDDITYLMVKRR
ncbi:MAG: response regulator [Spirochaetes bacterium]|nr:response regulator [Spirochaetota bacterium]